MKTILVIDDEDSIAEMIELILSDQGYHVVTARNGSLGLQRLATLHVDLILCDVMMPGLSGIEVANQIRADPQYHTLPIILMSAGLDKLDMDSVVFLRKPFMIDHLLDTVRTAFR